MEKIAIVTDSNSGITQKQAEELGIYVLPMPFYINDELFLEGINLSQEEFYQRLSEEAEIHTSQPSPADVMDLWNKLLKEYEAVVHIPMSSGLSASCQTACALAADYQGKVQVVNNQRISVTQRQSVLDAIQLVGKGKSARQIRQILEEEKLNSSIYLTLETLKYLKRGGRITPAAAAIGTVLNLKPVLQIQGEKLDAFSKARGKAKAKRIMLDAMRHDLENRFATEMERGLMALEVAYAGNYEEAMEWKREVEAEFPDMDCWTDALSLSIACHVGPGVLAVACAKKIV